MARRGPKPRVNGGSTRSYYLGVRHTGAIGLYRQLHGHPSEAGALRAILDGVADELDVIDKAADALDIEIDNAARKAGWV